MMVAMDSIIIRVILTVIPVLYNVATNGGGIVSAAPSSSALSSASRYLSPSIVEKQVEFFPRPITLYSTVSVIDKVMNETSSTAKAGRTNKNKNNKREMKLITTKNLQQTSEVLIAATSQLANQAHVLGLGLIDRSKSFAYQVQTINQQQFLPFMTSFANQSKHTCQRSIDAANTVSRNIIDNTNKFGSKAMEQTKVATSKFGKYSSTTMNQCMETTGVACKTTKQLGSKLMEQTKVATSKFGEYSSATLKQCMETTGAACQTTVSNCKTISCSMARGSKSIASTFAGQSKRALDQSIAVTSTICEITAAKSKVAVSKVKDTAVDVSMNVGNCSKAATCSFRNFSGKACQVTVTKSKVVGRKAKNFASNAAYHSKTAVCKAARISGTVLDRSASMIGKALKATGAKSTVLGSQMKNAAVTVSNDVWDVSEKVGSNVFRHSESAALFIANHSKDVLDRSVAVTNTACKATAAQSKILGSQVKRMGCNVGEKSQVIGSTVVQQSKRVANTITTQAKLFMDRSVSLTRKAYESTASKSKVISLHARTFAVAMFRNVADKSQHVLDTLGRDASVKTVSALDRSKHLLRAGGTETVGQARRTAACTNSR
mmetsp:Transcript_7728/g.11061  ORF Transcript_7728/g.11061 Transcript_7728/m.11061 type:complete len:604 (+) Transcript_7728:105-1916(+)